MRFLVAVMLLSVLSVHGQSLAADDLTITPDWMSAEGHWAKRNSTVIVECFKRSGFCVESRAWLEPSTKHILLRTFNYQISRWSNDGITAHNDGPVSGDLLITFGTKSVMLVTHEKIWGDETDHLEHGNTDTLHN